MSYPDGPKKRLIIHTLEQNLSPENVRSINSRPDLKPLLADNLMHELQFGTLDEDCAKSLVRPYIGGVLSDVYDGCYGLKRHLAREIARHANCSDGPQKDFIIYIFTLSLRTEDVHTINSRPYLKLLLADNIVSLLKSIKIDEIGYSRAVVNKYIRDMLHH